MALERGSRGRGCARRQRFTVNPRRRGRRGRRRLHKAPSLVLELAPKRAYIARAVAASFTARGPGLDLPAVRADSRLCGRGTRRLLVWLSLAWAGGGSGWKGWLNLAGDGENGDGARWLHLAGSVEGEGVEGWLHLAGDGVCRVGPEWLNLAGAGGVVMSMHVFSFGLRPGQRRRRAVNFADGLAGRGNLGRRVGIGSVRRGGVGCWGNRLGRSCLR